MRIGYLTHEPLPSPETSTEQLVWTVSMLARHGVDVDLIIPRSKPVTDRRGYAYREAIRRFYGSPLDLLPDNVRLVPVWSPGTEGSLHRATHDITSPVYASRRGYDLVYTRDLYALSLALLLGMPCVFETYRTDISLLRRYAAFRRFAYQHRRLVGVVTHSRLARDRFVEAGMAEGRLLVAHNGYSRAMMNPVLSKVDARMALGLPGDRPIVCYAGHVNPRKGIEMLIQVATRLADADFFIVGVIPGSESERFYTGLASDLGAPNVHFVPRVPPAEVKDYLYAADCLIIPPTAEPLERFHRTVLPMKTYLYLASGRAIVAPDLPDVREVLRDGANSVLVRPDDVEACVGALGRLLGDLKARQRLGAQARQDAESYTWEARGRRIAGFLSQRVGERSR